MKASLQNQDVWSDAAGSPLGKGFLDIPTFEEAFDTISLRKFFHEQESTNSQSCLSPQKTSSLFDDDIDPMASPFARHLNRYYPQAPMQGNPFVFPNMNTHQHQIQFNVQEPFNVVRRVKSNVEPQNYPLFNKSWDPISTNGPITNVQITLNKGNMTVKKPLGAGGLGIMQINSPPVVHTPPPEILPYVQRAQSMFESTQPSLIQKGQSFCGEETRDERFEKMLKSKKVFKIQREEQRKQIVINFKKKAAAAASALNEGATKKVEQKKAKNCLPVAKKNNVVFNFTSNASSEQSKTTPSGGLSPAKFLNVFDGLQTGQQQQGEVSSGLGQNDNKKVELQDFPWGQL